MNGKRRREILKISSRAAIMASAVGAVGQGVSASEDDDWECESGCPDEVVETETVEIRSDEETVEDGNLEGSLSVHWFESFSDNGTIHHKLGISGAAEGREQGGNSAPLHGQEYKVEAVSDVDEISRTTNNDFWGHYPCPNNSGDMPGWAQPLVEEAISTIDPTNLAGWFTAVGESLNEAMGHHADGFVDEAIDIGFKYKNTNDFWSSNWHQCCFYTRFDATCEYTSKFKVSAAYNDANRLGQREWKEVEMEIATLDDSAFPITTSIEDEKSLDALTKEERDNIGAKKVTDDSNITRTVSGEQISPDYIFVESPLSVGTIEKKSTTEEVEQFDPLEKQI